MVLDGQLGHLLGSGGHAWSSTDHHVDLVGVVTTAATGVFSESGKHLANQIGHDLLAVVNRVNADELHPTLGTFLTDPQLHLEVGVVGVDDGDQIAGE